MDRLEANKQSVMAFYDVMFNQCRPAEAIERYAGDVYLQHNPDVGDGQQAFIDDCERMAAEYPGERVDFKRAIAGDRYVVLHCHQTCPGDHDYAGIDIFRLDDTGKASSTGTYSKSSPDTSKNDNGMFRWQRCEGSSDTSAAGTTLLVHDHRA
jgi:predicted SnoaL-like aldol condensation-catalyzing enzyme